MPTITFQLPFALPAAVQDIAGPQAGVPQLSADGSAVSIAVPMLVLPEAVSAGLAAAGFTLPPTAPATAPAETAAAPIAAVPVDLADLAAQFAPQGLQPQGAEVEDPQLAGAVAAAQILLAGGGAAAAAFQDAAHSAEPGSPEGLAQRIGAMVLGTDIWAS